MFRKTVMNLYNIKIFIKISENSKLKFSEQPTYITISNGLNL